LLEEKYYTVSVIVPNHNRSIDAIRASVPRNVELFEVYLGMERSRQRNIGIMHSKGKYLLILDSDQSISEGLIDECLELMEQGYSALYIPEVIVASSFFGRVRAFEREFYTGTAIDVPRFVRRDCCPLFNEDLNGPEDADFGNRIKGERAVTRGVLYHHDDISFVEYCRKKTYYTKSMARYKELWPDDPCLSLRYRCWTVFVSGGKWKRLLRHPILTLGIIFVLGVRGWIYYRCR
jgi:glycosyltransferase involved in cell wall biosynthesis